MKIIPKLSWKSLCSTESGFHVCSTATVRLVSVSFVIRPTLKKCWFAVYQPTHHFAPYPIFFIAPSLYFFLSNFQTLKFFVSLFSGTVRPRRLKLGTHVGSGWMYRVLRNKPAVAAYLSLYFFIFLSLQFSNIKFFCHTFLRNCEAKKIKTWYTGGQLVNVLCIPESGCCCLFVPLFLHFSFSPIFKQKFFVTLFSGTVRTRRLKLGTHVDSGHMYRVYRNQAAAAYSSLYFFIFLSLQFSNIEIFRHTFLRNYEA